MPWSAEQQARASRWLLAAQLLVILPLYTILPLWTLLLWLAMAAWYWRIISAGWPFPPTLVKLGLVVLAMSGIYLQYQRLFAVEPMVAMLVFAVVLKLVELKTLRDHWVVLFLCYFIVGCGFLFDQSLLTLLLALVQLLAILAAQQVLYRHSATPRSMLKLSSTLLLQALPMMLFMFMVFPRFGPLWSMPLPSQQGRTGMSDSLEFGDIASLSQSGELAFRATFAGGAMPPVAELYWRGLVLDEFDGRRWRRDKWSSWKRGRAGGSGPPLADGGLAYTVTLEGNLHDWVYSLAPSQIDNDDVFYGGDYQWLTRKPVLGRMQYRGRSNAQTPRLESDAHILRRSLQLAGNTNPAARDLGRQWSESLDDPADRVSAALAFYRQGNFIYTLQPPTLGENNVDEFLFGTRRGFCEHFAASFVFTMRAAQVPARLVVGYQGGEYNTDQGYLLVHQSDAHAWAEVWLDGRGWVRVDPTATISPDRVSRGASIALRGEQGFLEQSPLSLRRFDWANRARMYFDSLNYAWARWVVNYDTESQLQVMANLLGKITLQRILLAMAICVALPLAIAALWAIRPSFRHERDRADRYYLAACRRLARRSGLTRSANETPRQFLERVIKDAPQWQVWLGEVTALYEKCQYMPQGTAAMSGLIEQLRLLRRPRIMEQE